MQSDYKKRIADKLLEKKLKVFGGVLVEGAKLVGKSRTCGEFAKTKIKFQDPELKDFYKITVSTNPTSLLDGKKPILFDEWQDNHTIWDVLRHSIDESDESGMYLLTGSANIKKDDVMHSGTGRIVRIKMYPMSLFESGDSNGKVSLSALFNGKHKITAECDMTINKIIDLIIRGGFPRAIDKTLEEAIILMNGYYDNLINEKIQTIDGIKRNSKKMNSLLKSYARNISTYASDLTIKRDMENEDIELSDVTFRDYKNTLERLYIIDNVESWPTSIRSKKSIRKSDKKLLVDTSLVCSALGLSKDKIMRDFRYFGLLFEAICIRDLRIYVESIDGQIYHYYEQNTNKNSKDYEIDAILELRDGRWGAVEIKLGADELDSAATKLLELKNKINTDIKGDPSFLMILYAGKVSYKREDGVLVVSIGSLKN